jgi:hypothetical protein
MKPYRSDRHTAITVLSDIEEKAVERDRVKSVFGGLPIPPRPKKTLTSRIVGLLRRPRK